VGEQHLVDEPVRQQRVLGNELDLVQDLESPSPDLVHVGADLPGAKDWQFAADLARLLDRVVELAEVASERLAAPDPADQPELLEVRDVPEVPDQGTEDRVVDAIELLVGERLDQLQGMTARLLQTPGQLGLAVGSGARSILGRGSCDLRDGSTLPRWPRRLVTASVAVTGAADASRGCKQPLHTERLVTARVPRR
jgi:hypothetical protein